MAAQNLKVLMLLQQECCGVNINLLELDSLLDVSMPLQQNLHDFKLHELHKSIEMLALR